MDKKELLEELEKNVKTFRNIEDNYSMLMIALYQKSIEKIKNKKIAEIKEYFNSQVEYYEQNILENENKINNIINKYISQIDALTEAYDYIYSTTYESMQKAINNQLIAIGNIVTLWDKRNQDNNLDNEKIGRQIIALAQKKVNYSVIVEECKARLDWCIENVQNDLKEIFENKFYELTDYKMNFWDKLKRKILNLFNGKNKFAEIINKYKTEDLKLIEKNNKLKVLGTISTAKAILKQIQNVENQINSQYEETAQNP